MSALGTGSTDMVEMLKKLRDAFRSVGFTGSLSDALRSLTGSSSALGAGGLSILGGFAGSGGSSGGAGTNGDPSGGVTSVTGVGHP